VENLTEDEFLSRIKVLGLPEGDVRIKRVVCALVGHSNIVTNCFGYKNCARCDEQVGDSLGGVWSGAKAVIVDHDCETCRENYAKMDWKDKLFVEDPFVEKESELEEG
jgi:hypothetical protein